MFHRMFTYSMKIGMNFALKYSDVHKSYIDHHPKERNYKYELRKLPPSNGIGYANLGTITSSNTEVIIDRESGVRIKGNAIRVNLNSKP